MIYLTLTSITVQGAKSRLSVLLSLFSCLECTGNGMLESLFLGCCTVSGPVDVGGHSCHVVLLPHWRAVLLGLYVNDTGL